MARSPTPLLLHELQNPPDLTRQLIALRALKNEIIGHELQKRTWVSHGIITILSKILCSRRSHHGKRASKDVGDGSKTSHGRITISDEDACCLQAAVLVGIIARGT